MAWFLSGKGKTKPTIIYFIQAENGLIKIGITSNLKARLKTLSDFSPIHLKLLATIPGTEDDEKDLHQRFSLHCDHGEWFRPCDDLLGFIEKEGEKIDNVGSLS